MAPATAKKQDATQHRKETKEPKYRRRRETRKKAYRVGGRSAAEIEADALLKGTHSGVDGVYSADPRTNDDAVKYDEVGYMEVMTKDLKVMDATAIAFCRDNAIPIVVFDMSQAGSLRSILDGESVGTIVH